jgi:hypothetical protein
MTPPITPYEYSVMIKWECGHRVLLGDNGLDELMHALKVTLEFIRTRDDVNEFDTVFMTPTGNYRAEFYYKDDFFGTGFHYRTL